VKKSVGIIVITRIPNGELAAVLQRRGVFNFEKTKRESYPGCSQVTAHGGLKEGEGFYDGLIRESLEELGEEFVQLAKNDTELFELVHDNDTEKEVITFGAFVAWERIKSIRLLPESGGIDIVPQSEIGSLVEITKDMKETGCSPSIRALFPDEIEAIKKAFDLVSVNC
jgi:hypothetical protein